MLKQYFAVGLTHFGPMFPFYTPRKHLKTRSSRPEVVFKKVALKNFAKVIGKHLCWSLFFNKVAEIFKNTFFHRTHPVAASAKASESFFNKNTYFYRAPPMAASLISYCNDAENSWVQERYFAKQFKINSEILSLDLQSSCCTNNY